MNPAAPRCGMQLKKPPAATALALVFLVVIRPDAARACIGPPHVDLWYLATRSDVIVVGRVSAVHRSPLARFERLLESVDEALLELEHRSRGTFAATC
jgi:hypothetical protein